MNKLNANLKDFSLDNFKCSYIQSVPTYLSWSKNQEYLMPHLKHNGPLVGYNAYSEKYEAFENNDLIPALVRIVNKKFEKNPCEGMFAWVKQYGFLVNNEGKCNPGEGESVEDFRREALLLTDLWKKYKQLCNEDIDGLRVWINVSVNYFWTASYDSDASHSVISDTELGALIAMGRFVLRKELLNRCTDLKITTDAIYPDEKINLFLSPPNLLQAMYLQFLFYIKSDSPYKICPVCYGRFIPKRKDQIYCQDEFSPNKCRETAKARRQRSRQNEKNTN